MQIAGCHVQWRGLAETVTVETLDRVNEAEGETELKKTAAAAEEGREKSVEKNSQCDLFAKSRPDEWIMGSLMRKSV